MVSGWIPVQPDIKSRKEAIFIPRRRNDEYATLRKAMWEKGYTQKDFARYLGVTQQMCSLYLSGKRKFPDEVKHRLHMNFFPERPYADIFDKEKESEKEKEETNE